jgi:hypothetical protein
MLTLTSSTTFMLTWSYFSSVSNLFDEVLLNKPRTNNLFPESQTILLQKVVDRLLYLPVWEDTINGHVSCVPSFGILVLAVSAPTKDGTLNTAGCDSSKVFRECAVIGSHVVFLTFGVRRQKTRRHQRTNIHVLGHCEQNCKEFTVGEKIQLIVRTTKWIFDDTYSGCTIGSTRFRIRLKVRTLVLISLVAWMNRLCKCCPL